MRVDPVVLFVVVITFGLVSCGAAGGGNTPVTPGQPSIALNTPSAAAMQISGHAYNFDSTSKVVVYVLTNQWYVQPLVIAPFTTIASDGTWSASINAWSSVVVLLVNPAIHTAVATEIPNPALDPGVITSTQYPLGTASLTFSGQTWPGNNIAPVVQQRVRMNLRLLGGLVPINDNGDEMVINSFFISTA